jgi:hypothetical protein
MSYRLTVALLVLSPLALAQLNQNCTVSVLNRTVPVNADGSWVLPNIPANFGQVKARATCIQNGQTIFGESAFFTVPANGAANLPAITLGGTTPIPVSLALSSPASPLTAAGQTSQLTVTATYPNSSTGNVAPSATGTNYTISNPAIATITADGLVTAVSSGTVVIQATNDGASGILSLSVNLGGASVGGIPVSWLLANNLNANDPNIALEDQDRDGLTNLQEYQLGTNPNNPDTDADGLTDGDEVNKYHTSPLLSDTDGDLIPDGVEITTGTNPLDRTSYDLKKATAISTLTPSSFTLATSLANPVVSQQLSWKVLLIDNKTTLDLTADPRTNYASNNLTICSFGVKPGLIFSGSTGSCTITISQNTLTVTDAGTVTGFTPVEISTLVVPGAVAVDVSGGFAYVATGTNGLTVVDINDRFNPHLRGTLSSIGNIQAVRAYGQNVFVADANGFLRSINAQNPLAPSLTASLPIPSGPTALALHNNTIAVAAQAGGVSLVNVANPANLSLIATLPTTAPALGVDFDPATSIAAVAMGPSGLQVADFSNPASPRLRGALPGGNVRRVLLRLPAALLADSSRSVTAVDLTNPDNPSLSLSLAGNLGGIPVDIAAYGALAITADQSFGRAIPLINISTPLQPSSVGFWTLLSPGFSSSVAVDVSFGYVIIPATSTLRILKYQQIVDPYGIPPVISITAPVSGTPLIQGQTVTLSANATDDVAVASVMLTVNAQPLFTSTNAPYQSNYTVPLTATSLTFGGTAIDYGNNIGTAQNVTVAVIPDPGTTVIGRVVDASGNPVAGATVSVTPGTRSSTTVSDGSFSITQAPTVQGSLQVTATFLTSSGVTLAGVSITVPPVTLGTTNAGTISVLPVPKIVSPLSALAGSQVTMIINGGSLTGATFAFQPAAVPPIAVNVTSTNPAGTSATLALNIPATAIGTFALVATTASGSSTSSIIAKINRFTVVDPNSHADTDGDGFQDVIEALFGTDPLDPTSFPVIPVATETESAPFSTLNAPVVQAGIRETESVAFSILNAPVMSAGISETESVAFSILNAPASTAGIRESESINFGVLNNAVGVSSANPPRLRVGPAKSSSQAEGAGIQAQSQSVDPFVDSDGDGLPDWLERLLGTDPNNPDTDGDGLSDYQEVFIYRTNPLSPDTDGDGFTDGSEVLFGSDPLNPNSTPLTVIQRADLVTPNPVELAKTAAPVPSRDRRGAVINTNNSTLQGGTHVKSRSKKQKPGKAADAGSVSSGFATRSVAH